MIIVLLLQPNQSAPIIAHTALLSPTADGFESAFQWAKTKIVMADVHLPRIGRDGFRRAIRWLRKSNYPVRWSSCSRAPGNYQWGNPSKVFQLCRPCHRHRYLPRKECPAPRK